MADDKKQKENGIKIDEKTISKDNKKGEVSFQLQGNDALEFLRMVSKQKDESPNIQYPADYATEGYVNNELFEDIDTSIGSLYDRYSWRGNVFDISSISNILKSNFLGDKTDIFVAMEMYRRDSLMRRITELMVQFSLSKMLLERGNKKINKFYEEWLRLVYMRRVLKWFFMEYYKTANVTIVKQKLNPLVKRSFDRTRFIDLASKEDDKVKQMSNKLNLDPQITPFSKAYLKSEKAESKKIPFRYTILDPRLVDIRVANGLPFGEVYYYPNADVLNKMIKAANGEVKSVRTFLKGASISLIEDVNKGKASIQLDPSFACQYFRLKQPYERYAMPLSSTASSHLQFKNKLRDMDLSIVNSVKNKILKVTVGDKDRPAKVEELKALNYTLSQDSPIMTILWNYTLKMEWIEPTFTDLDSSKYDNVDKDIKTAFGITPVLLGETKNQNYATAFVSMKAFVQNLNDGIEEAEDFVNNEVEEVARVMQFDTAPEFKLSSVDLTDVAKMTQLAQAANDRSILSNETVCEMMGKDWPTELARMEREAKLRQKGVLISKSPNTLSSDEKDDDEKRNDMKKNNEGDQSPQKDRTNDNDPRPRKNDAASLKQMNLNYLFKLKHVGSIIYNKLYDILKKKDKNISYREIARVMSFFPKNTLSLISNNFGNIDIASLEENVSNKKQLEAAMLSEVDKILDIRNNIKKVSKDVGKDIVSEAWAIFHIKNFR